MFNQGSALTVFRCPACAEYIASDSGTCRFCLVKIDPEVAHSGLQQQAVLNQVFRRRTYRTHMIRGGALLLASLSFVIFTYYFSEPVLGTTSFWAPRVLMIGGGADFLYGIYGLLIELRND
jgi:hypothetical protein